MAMGDVDEIEAAVEEFLRFDGPTPSMVRVAVADHEIDGHAIEAGQRIYAVIAAANRDPDVFEAPDALDVTRLQHRHYAFGYGTHFCLGAPLARLEALLALPALHRAFPRLEINGEPEWADGLTLRGPVSLPVRLRA
jgi:cytochrome P450